MNVWYQTNMTNTPAQEEIQDAENNEQRESETTEQVQESEIVQESESAQESETAIAQESGTANAQERKAHKGMRPQSRRKMKPRTRVPPIPTILTIPIMSECTILKNWRLWSQDLSTQESTTLFVEDLQLKEGEYITALAFEHGRVEEGFGTLSQEDGQWDRRERYENNDTLENTFDSTELSSWNNETCSQVLDALYQEKNSLRTSSVIHESN